MNDSNKQARLYGVIGNPIHHSVSPMIHNRWFEDAGIFANYFTLRLESETPASDLEAMARFGVAGLNVTLPFKLDALKASATASDAANAIGASNTLVPQENGVWHAENTDWTGFLWSLDRLFGDSAPERVLVIGAGGAARGICYALKQRNLPVTMANRTRQNAVRLLTDLDMDQDAVIGLEDIPSASGFPLIVNTASSGHSGQSIEVPNADGGIFMDISYGAAAAQSLESARNHGWKTEDGMPMLIAQAADSFQFWTGKDPDREAALTRIRNHLSTHQDTA